MMFDTRLVRLPNGQPRARALLYHSPYPVISTKTLALTECAFCIIPTSIKITISTVCLYLSLSMV